MKRDLLNELEAWKIHPLRKPLILRGARQVGKSWLIEEFGKQFEVFISINFEKTPEAKQLFEAGLTISELLEKLSLLVGKKIEAGKSLLFLDEIQECEKALVSLRYFKEDYPELHVIAAGSLLDFAIDKLGVAVGRVQFLYLYPLSFLEFLTAQDRDDLRNYIDKQINDAVIHQQLMTYLKTYLWLGGMPAVVGSWLRFKDVRLSQEAQDEILQAYKQDFQKYAHKHQLGNVEKMFEAIPQQLGKKFTFTGVDGDSRAAPLKNALQLLSKAGIAHIVYHSSGQGQPLGATKNEKKFKVFYFDVGLAQRMLGLDLKSWVTQPLEVRHVGAVAEQLVAQEYITYTSIKASPDLYYWHREERNSNAKVDFLFLKKGMIVPVEVKAGLRGGLKSIALFLESHPHSTTALKISEKIYEKNGLVQNIPFYGIKAWLENDI